MRRADHARPSLRGRRHGGWGQAWPRERHGGRNRDDPTGPGPAWSASRAAWGGPIAGCATGRPPMWPEAPRRSGQGSRGSTVSPPRSRRLARPGIGPVASGGAYGADRGKTLPETPGGALPGPRQGRSDPPASADWRGRQQSRPSRHRRTPPPARSRPRIARAQRRQQRAVALDRPRQPARAEAQPQAQRLDQRPAALHHRRGIAGCARRRTARGGSPGSPPSHLARRRPRPPPRTGPRARRAHRARHSRHGARRRAPAARAPRRAAGRGCGCPRRQRPHPRAAIGMRLDQALALEQLQRRAHRRRADAQPRGQRGDGQLRAGRRARPSTISRRSWAVTASSVVVRLDSIGFCMIR